MPTNQIPTRLTAKPTLAFTPARSMAARHQLELVYMATLKRGLRLGAPDDLRWDDLGLTHVDVVEALANHPDDLDGALMEISTRARTQATIDYNMEAWTAIPDGFKKRWVAHHDPKTRHAHLDLDGITLKKWSPFKSGEFRLQYPGDPSAPPELTFNCRCVIMPVAPSNITASAMAAILHKFQYQPGQWRNPRNGRWVDMPWTVLRGMFSKINEYRFDRDVKSEPGDDDENWFKRSRSLHSLMFKMMTDPELRSGDAAEGALEAAAILDKMAKDRKWFGAQEGLRGEVEEAAEKLRDLASELLFTDEPMELRDVDEDQLDKVLAFADAQVDILESSGVRRLEPSLQEPLLVIAENARALVMNESQGRGALINKQVQNLQTILDRIERQHGERGGELDELFTAITMYQQWLVGAVKLDDWNNSIRPGGSHPKMAFRDKLRDLEHFAAPDAWAQDDRGLRGWTRRKPVSMDEAARLANIGGYLANCQKSVVAYDAQRRGYSEVFAGGRAGGMADDGHTRGVDQATSAYGMGAIRRYRESFARWKELRRVHQGNPEITVPFNEHRTAEKLMEDWPMGARGHLSVLWQDGGAHIVMVEKTPAGYVVVDPQMDQLVPLNLYLAPQMRARVNFLYRVDDLEIRSDRFTTDLPDSGHIEHIYSFNSEVELAVDQTKRTSQPVSWASNRDRSAVMGNSDNRAVRLKVRVHRELEGGTDGAGVQRGHAGGGELPRDEGSGDTASLGDVHTTIIGPEDVQTFKYNPEQLRVPKGNGKLSGRWLNSPFSLLSALVATYADRTGIDTQVTRTEFAPDVLRPIQEGDREFILERYGKPIPNNWIPESIVVDPEANSGVIARGKYLNKAGKEVPQALYTTEREDSAAAVKFNRVKLLSENVEKLNAGLESVGNDPTAAATRLMYLSGIRVGSSDEQRGAVKAYGATTLRMDHLTKNPDGTMQLNFTAKEGIPASYTINDPELVRYLEDRLNSGDTGDTRIFNTTSDKTKALLKRITGIQDVKNHDLRTLLANLHAVQLALAADTPKNQREWQSIRKEISTAVAEVLRNKPDQARKSYIAPAVFELLERA